MTGRAGAPGGSGIASRHIFAVLGIVLLAAAVLLLMGRVPICTCGTVKLWTGAVNVSENSQHLSDWYSPSHVVHGFLFFWLSWLFRGRAGLGLRLVAAVAVEAGWEILENTDRVIERYRAATVSLHYFGDSVVNSMSDIAFIIAGFLLASRLPAWATVSIAVGLELLTLAVIRDNLTLNVLMLVWPLDAVRRWQAGA